MVEQIATKTRWKQIIIKRTLEEIETRIKERLSEQSEALAILEEIEQLDEEVLVQQLARRLQIQTVEIIDDVLKFFIKALLKH